ncbi:carbamoyl phosphate synthase preATP-grasp domain-containing protein [Desulfosporosinus burensis]
MGQACEFDYSGTQACKALRKGRSNRSHWRNLGSECCQ